MAELIRQGGRFDAGSAVEDGDKVGGRVARQEAPDENRRVPFARKSEVEKQAARAAREGQRAAEEQARADAAFWTSPPGRARKAFAEGDQILQLSFDVINTQTYVIPMAKAGTTTRSNDPTVVLNAICREGWELVNGSFVFLQTGAESRDKFMASGQHVAVAGTIIGYYLFRRCEENRGVE